MSRVARMRLLLKIIERSEQEEWPRIDLVAGQFGGRRTDEWTGTKTAYIGWSFENIEDSALFELGEFFGLNDSAASVSSGEIGAVDSAAIIRIWGAPTTFRLFLSHVSGQKDGATKLKDELAALGVSAFVAHADILPTKEWLEEILRALKSMHGLAALLVPTFHASFWTDQELGYAIGRSVPIVPLKFGQDPYGFIGRFQALNCENLDAKGAGRIIVTTLLTDPRSESLISDSVGRRFANSGSWADAKALVALLEVPAKLPMSTLDFIAKAKHSNVQVQSAWGVPQRIENLFEKHSYLDTSAVVASEETDSPIPF